MTLFENLNGVKIHKNKSLKRLNTFGMDVKARYFCEARSVRDLQAVLRDEKLAGGKKLILGGGSNLLFTGDFEGLVIRNAIGGIRVTDETDITVTVKAGAGVVWQDLVQWSIRKGYAGLENLTEIPGLVGASPVQNVGAYGAEVKDTFQELEAVELATGAMRTFGRADCRFGYRDSIFKTEFKGRFCITSVSFKLARLSSPKTVYRFRINYGDVRRILEAMGVRELSLKTVSKAIAKIRQKKLPDPRQLPNAGSFFKNPLVSAARFRELSSIYTDMPGYPEGPDTMKIAAGWLIEQCGWKGKRVGRVGCHKDQSLVLINYGCATGREVLDLAESIQRSVRERFGVDLSPEVNIL